MLFLEEVVEIVFEDDRLVVLFVFGAVDEGEVCGFAVLLAEGFDDFVVLLQLGLIAFFEFGPVRGLVMEPLTELGGGREVFCPLFDGGFFFGDAPGPEPVDEDADTVRFCRGIIGPLDLDDWWHKEAFLFVEVFEILE